MFPPTTKILLVDDSSFSRTMTRNGLRELLLTRTVEAADVPEAQLMLNAAEDNKEPIGLIISDINMPGQTGLDLLRWVRAQKNLAGIPFLLLTASQDINEIHEAGRLAVSHFLLKPLTVPLLRERLVHAWQKHGEAYLKQLKVSAGQK